MLSAHHIVAIVVATFSILGNIFICLSCHLFKELSKDCLYNLVYWEALSALLYSTGFIFGTPESGSAECFSQALLFQYFGMSSMLAIYLILYHMNKLVTRDQTQVAIVNIQRRYTFNITWKSYVLVWVSPLLFLIIPLITESYGQSDRGERSRAPCWIRVERRTDLYVMLSVYYIPWFIIFMFCIYHVAIITWHTTKFGHQTIMSYVRRITLYPIIFFVSCMPGICLRVLIILYPDREYDMWIQSITAGVTAAQGFFSSLLFGSTPIVIRSWGKFSFAWLTREYLPQLWSKIRIIGSPRIDNDDGDDHIYTAAGL